MSTAAIIPAQPDQQQANSAERQALIRRCVESTKTLATLEDKLKANRLKLKELSVVFDKSEII